MRIRCLERISVRSHSHSFIFSIRFDAIYPLFAKETAKAKKKKMSEEPEEAYHYVGFVPVNGYLWEIDGLARAPIKLGTKSYFLFTWISHLCTPSSVSSPLMPVLSFFPTSDV